MQKVSRAINIASLAVLSLVLLTLPAGAQTLTGSVQTTNTDLGQSTNTTGTTGTTDTTGLTTENNLGQTTSGIAGPVGDPNIPNGGDGIFSLPNFEGDTREPDSNYYMHMYNYPAWDVYRQQLYSYAAQAQQQMSQGWPPPPYSQYNYVAGDEVAGPGGAVASPAGNTAVDVSGGSGVTVNANGGGITGKPSEAGENNGGTIPVTTLTGQLIQPPTIVPPAATVEPLNGTLATP